MSVVATVTQPATVTATSTGSNSSSYIPPVIPGIVFGSLFGGGFLIALAIFLLKRYRRHKFSRVANPLDDAQGADLGYLPRTNSQRSRLFSHHSQTPSISSEPLIPPSFPPLPFISRIPSSDTPPQLDPIFPEGIRYSSFDLSEITRVLTSGTVSRATVPAPQPSSLPSWSSPGDPPPHTRQTSGDSSPSTPSKPQPSLFVHRMLQLRAQASEGISLARRLSDVSQSRSTTLDSSDVQADEEHLLAEAEHTALRDAEIAREGEEVGMVEGEADWEDAESIYSQASAPVDQSGFLNPTSRRSSALSSSRRKSSRKQRMVTPAELSPVAEMPHPLRVLESQTLTRTVSIVPNSSLDAQVSHRTASPPISLGQAGAEVTLPLLASVNFGKSSATSHTPGGSISSIAALGSGSSGRASRYPSLAPSSVGLSSRSGPRSDASTDWHRPPSGLAGLTTLQIEPLRNPHSPVKEQSQQQHPEVLSPGKHARLREGNRSSIPEVEKRDVMLGGIACIDVAL